MRRTGIVTGLVIGICFFPLPGAAEQIATASAATAGGMGYGMMLFRMVLMLGAVCAFAMVTLRWGIKRLTQLQRTGQSIEVVSRAVIEPRRAIMVVRIGTRHLIVGTGEQGMTSLGELSGEEVSALREEIGEKSRQAPKTAPSFRKVFEKVAAAKNRQSSSVIERTTNTENAQSL